jgi:hypothetical protein
MLRGPRSVLGLWIRESTAASSFDSELLRGADINLTFASAENRALETTKSSFLLTNPTKLLEPLAELSLTFSTKSSILCPHARSV